MNSSKPVFELSRRGVGRLLSVVGAGLLVPSFKSAFGAECALPPRTPIEGPYFFGSPEEKTETGGGLIIRGVVRDVNGCQPVSGAQIVRWHANTSGVYEEYYRALMVTKTDGTYSLSTIKPGAYANLDPHVHWYVTASGYQPLIAQIQWPRNSQIPDNASFDFSLTRL